MNLSLPNGRDGVSSVLKRAIVVFPLNYINPMMIGQIIFDDFGSSLLSILWIAFALFRLSSFVCKLCFVFGMCFVFVWFKYRFSWLDFF